MGQIEEWRAFLAELRLMIVADPGLASSGTLRVDGDSIMFFVRNCGNWGPEYFYTAFFGEIIGYDDSGEVPCDIGFIRRNVGYAVSAYASFTARQEAETQGE